MSPHRAATSGPRVVSFFPVPLALDPFDSSPAPARTRIVPIEAVVDPFASQPHNPAQVEAYRQAMLNGAQFPPIAVVRVGSRYLVADGHKRLTAFRSFGPSEIRVETWRWRDWVRDQHRQARNQMHKHRQALRSSLTDPGALLQLWRSIMRHWLRIARAVTGARPAGR